MFGLLSFSNPRETFSGVKTFHNACCESKWLKTEAHARKKEKKKKEKKEEKKKREEDVKIFFVVEICSYGDSAPSVLGSRSKAEL